MSGITFETRQESEEKVDKQLRYSQIKRILAHGEELTAKEIAVMMMANGWIPSSERNYSAPRLTEMAEKGIVEVAGKRLDVRSNRRVATYRLVGAQD